MVEYLTQEQIRVYEAAFNQHDDQNSGTISTSNLLSVLHTVGMRPTDQELDELINECDKDWRSIIKDNTFLEMMGRYELK